MADRIHDLLRRAREPEPETTAPIDVKLRSITLTVVAAAATIAMLYWAREIFIPIVLSVLISYALEPVVAALIRLHFPRVIASALVIMTLTGGVVYTGYAVSDEAIAMVSEVAGQATLVVFFVFFLLASGDLFKRKLVKMAGPSLEKKKITVQILNEIDSQIEKFLLVRAVTSAAVGIATWLAFRWIGVHHAGVWGISAGVFNSVPYFGPVIVAGGTAVRAFVQFGTIGMALYVSGISVVITSLEGWLLTPWLTSRTARTNEVAIFVGLIFWSFVWGIWGTLLAVPMLVVVKAFCDRIEDLKPIGELLGE